MKRWNWQQSDWPKFTWDAKRLAKAEQEFLVRGGVLLGTMGHLDEPDSGALLIEAITTEALTTSEIEGELLDRDSVQSSIRRQLGLATDPLRAKPAEQGIAELMVLLYRTPMEPLSHAMLFGWHRMITKGRTDLKDVGRYRTHPEPMQVVSGKIHDPTVHFEAPPSAAVPEEMEQFVAWFNRTSPEGEAPLPAMTRAGLAQLYFVCIHPFEDGNGRIARALAEKALAQGLGRPTLTALAATILDRRREYYGELEQANKRNEVSRWLAWFAGVTLEAQFRTQAHAEFILEKTKLLDQLKGQLNPRQEKALLRMLREGSKGFEGGMTAGKYVVITGTTSATASRDLADLAKKGALVRSGQKKGAKYGLPIASRRHPRIVITAGGEVHMATD